MIVTILKNKTHTGRTIVKDIDDLTKLKTNAKKENSPLWNFTKTPNRKNDPETLSGMIIDYDHNEIPKLKKEYHHYYHQSHSGHYRVIVPFDREYDYPGKSSYQDEYIELLYNILDEDVEELFKKNIVQKTCCSPQHYFFMRPAHYPLHYHTGKEYYKPGFQIKTTNDLKRELKIIGHPFNYESRPEEAKRILMRMFSFYTYYGETIDWAHLDTKGYCVFDWHSGEISGCLFNYPTRNYKASIDCKHATCETKLREFMHPYQPEGDGKTQPMLITCKTVLYMAAAIILGDKTGWSLESVEATGFRRYRHMLSQIDRLKRLRFNAKIDSVNWVKTYHANAVMDPETQDVFCYEGNVYVQKNTDLLKYEYDYTIGTYFAYRLNNKRVSSSNYVDQLLRHSLSYMLDNFKYLHHKEHLNLKNGLLILDYKKGTYDFRPHSRHIFSREKLDYEYDEKATCPLWEKTLTDYFDDINSPSVQMLQRFFGYCLTFDRRLEKLLFLFGASRGGKNTICQTLINLVGGGEISMEFLLIPERRSSLAAYKKMVFIDEMPSLNSNKVINELKKISSTDAIEMRKMCGQPYRTTQIPKLIIAFNEMPENFEIDKALKNRMLALKFIKSFAGKENIHLKDDLLLELSGILNWALEGYKQLYDTKSFGEADHDANELYYQANEQAYNMGEFLKNRQSKKLKWRTTELLTDYKTCAGDYKMTQFRFNRLIRPLGVVKKVIEGYSFYDLSELKDITTLST